MKSIMKVGQVYDDEGPLIVSKLEDETFSFSWELHNFSKLQNNVKSPPFDDFVGSNHQRKWCIEVFPKSERDGTEYLGVFLNLSSDTKNSSVTARYKISLVDSARRVLVTMGSNIDKEFKPLGSGWGLNRWISTSDLLTKRFVTDDILRICCCITTHSELKHQPFDPKSKKEDNPEVLVRNQMNSLLNSGEFSDVTLKTTTNSFACSKIVLAAHSPVFYAMFNSGMLETQENVVKIEDFENEVVKGMLEFLYKREVEFSPENVTDLLKIADKYQINGLKTMCVDFLLEQLNIENAAETLILADLHGPVSLKQKVISFISRNRKTFQRTDGYVLMQKRYKTLLADLYIALQ